MKKCHRGREIDGKCIKTFNSLDELVDNDITSKGAYANRYLKGITFDYALPEGWLYSFCRRRGLDYNEVTRSTYWVYPKGSIAGMPFSMRENINKEFDEDRS